MTAIDDRRAQIKTLFDSGLNPVEIGSRMSLPANTVHNDLRAVGAKDAKTTQERNAKPKASRESRAALTEVMKQLALPVDVQSVRSKEPETRRAIIQGLADRGLDTNEISAAMGLSYKSVAKAAKASGIAIRRSRPPKSLELARRNKETAARAAVTAARRSEVGRLVAEGKSGREIADILGCDITLVYSDTRTLGIKMAPKSTIVNDERLIRGVSELAAEGKVTSEIAEALGCTGAHVREIAKKHGITLPRVGQTHGIVSTYRSGCKCDQCVAVGRKYDAERRKIRLESKVKPERVHGTVGGSTNWGCTCERCLEAVRVANRDAVALPMPVEKLFVRWTEEEDAVALDRSMTAREAAIKLGRSVSAVNGRRKHYKDKQAASALVT